MNTKKLRKLLKKAKNNLSIFYSAEILNLYDFNTKEYFDLIKDFIFSLPDESIEEILTDTDLITNKLHLQDFQIVELIKGLSTEKSKIRIIKIYQLGNKLEVDIINTFDNSSKVDIILKEKKYSRYDKIKILKSLDSETLGAFLTQHREFLSENDIQPYEIILLLNTEQQKDFVANLEHIDLELSEKIKILLNLKEDVKKSIDTTNFPKEYKTALSIQTREFGGENILILDLERDLEDYRGLDNFIRINPEEFTKEQRVRFMKICDICPNLQIVTKLDNNEGFISSAKEYKEAEEWIYSIIDGINPEYSKAQKMAIIDNAIGKKISYSPDFDTEVFDIEDCRALWKIISCGYGVCGGIAKVEQYILNRVGIKSEIISSKTHAFLKIKDIEIPFANGKIVKGNTILDPTWNLTAHRFGAQPNSFCISYEQSRNNDIDIEGTDSNCHKNDEKLQDVNLNLDEQSLKSLFTSVGLANKEGQFPIKDLFEKSKFLHELFASQPYQDISKQLLLLSKYYPEFAMCQNATMSILSNLLLNDERLKFNKCVISRVYDKKDEEKRPVIFVYIDFEGLGNKFYFADKNKKQFIELPQEEFIERFECYEKDKKRHNRT